MPLIAELRRRNVFRMAGLYLVGAWLVVQIAETLLPIFHTPDWVLQTLVMLLALGFIPALVFSWVFELTPEGLKRDHQVPAGESIAHETGRRMDRLILAGMAVLALMIAADRFWPEAKTGSDSLSPVAGTSQDQARESESDPVSAQASIAVLPFANLSADPEQAYFSDGLAEDLITALSQFGGLKVISRNSSFQFRSAGEDSRAIGEKLGVARLLAGSVRRAGDVVRVSVDLVDTADGSTLWSQRFDRPYQDLFVLQDEITAAVAGELKAKLLEGGGAVAQNDRPPSGNLEAYNAYLLGNHLGRTGGEGRWPQMVAAYEQALALDPDYAAAEAQLARTLVFIAAGSQGGDEAERSYARARELAASALAHDPNLALAHRAQADVLVRGSFDWRGAEQAYRRALALDPNNAGTLATLGDLLGSLGQSDEALAMARRAVEIDPLSGAAYYRLADALFTRGELEEAAAAIQHAYTLRPLSSGIANLVIVRILQGRYPEALAAAETVPSESWGEIARALALQKAGDRAAADAALAALIEHQADVAAYQVAQVQAVRGDREQVFAWLQRAWTNRDTGISNLVSDPLLVPYRDDPRFAALAREVGLPMPGAAP